VGRGRLLVGGQGVEEKIIMNPKPYLGVGLGFIRSKKS